MSSVLILAMPQPQTPAQQQQMQQQMGDTSNVGLQVLNIFGYIYVCIEYIYTLRPGKKRVFCCFPATILEERLN